MEAPSTGSASGYASASLSSTPIGTPQQCRSPVAQYEDTAVTSAAASRYEAYDERSNSPFRTSEADENFERRKKKVSFFR